MSKRGVCEALGCKPRSQENRCRWYYGLAPRNGTSCERTKRCAFKRCIDPTKEDEYVEKTTPKPVPVPPPKPPPTTPSTTPPPEPEEDEEEIEIEIDLGDMPKVPFIIVGPYIFYYE